MNDTFDDAASPFPAAPAAPAKGEAAPEPASDASQTPDDPVLKRFTACRWHEKQDDGTEYCAHRDVLPYAGKHGFTPESWCPDCRFYKLRRKVRKREPDDYDY